MEKRAFIGVFAVLIIGFIFLLGLTGFASAFSGSGDGSLATPYTITNCTQLQEMGNALDANYSLGNNVNCADTVNWNNGYGFIAVGNSTAKFTGSLNGQEHSITGLYIFSNESYPGDYLRVGLFGQAAGINISNVVLSDVNFTGSCHVGGLIGQVSFGDSAIITNCSSSGSVGGSPSGCSSGGLAGYFASGAISDSHSSVNVFTFKGYAGGLVGQMVDSNVSNCYATGNIINSAPGDSCMPSGGLIGQISKFSKDSIINKSFATGNVTADCSGGNAGGLVGEVNSGAPGVFIYNSFATGNIISGSTSAAGGLLGLAGAFVFSSYATGTVNGSSAGGLVGNQQQGGINDSYATGNVYGTSRVGGFIGNHAFATKVYNSYSTGNVTGTGNVGGFVGYVGQFSGSQPLMFNSYSTGNVTGTGNVGGFAGAHNYGNVSNCYYDIYRSSQASALGTETCGVDCIFNVTGANSGNSQPSYFYTASNPPMDFWNFTTTWLENATTYPTLGNMPVVPPAAPAVGSLTVSLVGMANATVTQGNSFTFNSNVSCTGGTCGNVSAYLDPAALFETKDKQLNDISETKVVNNSARIIVVVLLILAFAAVLLIAPSNKKMVFGLIFAVLLVASVAMTFQLTGHVAYEVVSTTVGATPFYTTSANPGECGVLASGDSCSNSWTVVASGSAATYEFFVKYNSTTAGVGEANTSSVFITINVPAAAATTTTTTSSGGGGRAAQIYELSDDDFKKGYRHEVYVNDVLRFNFMGGVHTIKIISVRGGEIRFVVASEPIIVDLKIGETKAIDIDGNGENDMNVELISAERGAADIVLKSIVIEQPLAPAANETMPLPELSKEGKINLIWAVIFIVVIVAALIVTKNIIKLLVSRMIKKNKARKSKSRKFKGRK